MAGRPIDEKIVVMRLDNSDFKQKAVETTGLFGKLKDSLNKVPGVNLGKTVNELDGIKKAVGNTKMDHLATAVQGVGSQFSAMSVIATTALATIVNKAVNAGTALAKSLSLDQVTSGFQEYELKMGSIQTILANTQKHGTTLKDVTKSFEELNDYADKTIYNFGDMTRNIGLFTNAGLKLEESTSMIKGFSNMAAASGTNSERAAGAAYQLSQGLSSGYLMTMDWMSLTNAGMGNDNMKRDLIALGKAMGTLDDHYTEKDVLEDWKNLLTDEKWLTSDVMSTYLQTMAGDMDTASLKALGLTDAQIKLMEQNAKTGEDAATKTRTFTAMMDTLKESIGSGWAVTFETILGDFNEATNLFSKAGDFLTGLVGKSSDARNKLLKDVADGGGMKNIFAGIGNAVKPLMQIFSSLKTAFRMVFPPTSAATIIKITEAFKKFTEGLVLAPGQITQLTNIFRGLFSIFSTAWEIVKRLTAAFINLIPEGAGGSILDIIEKVAKMSTSFNRSVKEGNGLTRFIDGVGSALKTLGGFLGDIGGGVVTFAGFLVDNLGKAINWIKDALAPVGQYFKEAFGGSYGDEALGAGTLVAIFAIVKKIKDFFDGDFDIFGGLSDIVEGISETFSGIGEAVNNFATSIKYVNLILIATAIGILAVSLKILEGIDAEDIGKGITALALSLGVMIAGMVVMSKFNVTGGIKAAVTLIALAAAVSIMASALKKISDLDTAEIAKGVSGLAAIVASLSLALIAISKFGGKISVGSLQLIALAGAVVILASAVKTLSEIKTGDLFIAIGALTLIFGALAAFLKVVDGSKFGVGSAVGILIVTGAIKVMVTAIEDIAAFDVATLTKGLVTITLILAQIALFSKVAGGPQMLLAGTGMLMMAGALNAMIGPITTFAGMSWEELAKGMAAMAVSLGILAGAAYLMTGGILGAVGVIAMALALRMLVEPIERFAAMSWGEMLKGFAGVTIGMGLMAGAALLLTPAVPSMLAFGAGLLLMGAAVLAAGIGMSAFGTGLVTLASLTAGSVAAIISALSLLIQGLGTLVGDVVSFVVKIVSALIDGLAVLIPKLIDMGWKIITAFMDGMEANMPNLVDKGGQLIIKMLEGMNEHIPAIVESVVTLMNNLATSVEQNSGSFINAWLSLMTEVSVVMVKAGSAVIDALFGWIPGVGDVTSQIGEVAELNIREAFDAQKVAEDKGTDFANTLSGTSGAAGAAGTTIAGAAETGANTANLAPIGTKHGVLFSTGLVGTQGEVRGAGTTIGKSAEQGAGTANLNPIGAKAGGEYGTGVTSKVAVLRNAGVSLANSGKNGASSVSLTTTGQQFGQGFANGMSSKLGTIVNVGKGLAAAASGAISRWLDIRSPSRVTTKQGQHTGQGFANGIASKKKESEKQAKAVATSAKKGFNNAMDNAEYKFKMGKIDSKKYIAEIKSIRNEYKKYPELVRKADLEIKKVQDNAAKHKESLRKKDEDAKKKAFENEKKRIDDLKYFGELTLKQELAFWEKIQKKYKKGTEERREADRETFRIKKEISQKILDDEKAKLAKQKELIDDKKDYNAISLVDELKAMQLLNTKYKKGSDERKATEKEIYRLKNELNDKMMAINDEYVAKIEESNQRLIDGERELNAEYENALNERTKALSGFAGIFDKINNDTEVTGSELVDNLKGQVYTFREWASNIQTLAGRGLDTALLDELREMGPASAAQIAALTSLTSDELQNYSYLWKTKNELARSLATKELEGMKSDTAKKIEELRKETTAQLTEYQKEWTKKIEELSKGTKDQFIDLKAAMTNIGGNTIRGLMSGMKDMEGPLKKQAQDMANAVANTIRGALRIKSPSRVTTGFGEFVAIGLANGMQNEMSTVEQSALDVANVARESILNLIDSITPDNNVIELDVKLNTDGMDLDSLNRIRVPVDYIPDTSFTRGMATSVRTAKTAPVISSESSKKTAQPQNVHNVDVVLNYNGSGSEEDARDMIDYIEQELGARSILVNAMRGVK